LEVRKYIIYFAVSFNTKSIMKKQFVNEIKVQGTMSECPNRVFEFFANSIEANDKNELTLRLDWNKYRQEAKDFVGSKSVKQIKEEKNMIHGIIYDEFFYYCELVDNIFVPERNEIVLKFDVSPLLSYFLDPNHPQNQIEI